MSASAIELCKLSFKKMEAKCCRQPKTLPVKQFLENVNYFSPGYNKERIFIQNQCVQP